jgi:4-amino-4-deoxy-L-arabinose transferase-like glycosyltransferase
VTAELEALRAQPGRSDLNPGVRMLQAWLAGPLAAPLVLACGAVLRLWHINDVGYNSDEAVYAGQAAAITGDMALTPYFPIFRAHPILFQSGLSVVYQFAGVTDLYGRLAAAAIGLATVYLVYLLGSELYGKHAGILAALFLALMPYHVVVTRQVLLDGPVAFFSTLALYLVARFAHTGQQIWLYAAGAALGLTVLSKTNGIVLVAAPYAFFALSPTVRARLRDLLLASVCMLLVIASYPLTIVLAGRSETGRQYLAWQLFRPPNHDWSFYLTTIPMAIGPLVILAALGCLWLMWRQRSWRETLLWAWIVVPVVFFQLWPTKGFQYLLPVAPPIAVLAGGAVGRGLATIHRLRCRRWLAGASLAALVAAALMALTLLVPSWRYVQPAGMQSVLAGSGGVPGGREAGWWVGEHVPEGAQLLAIGPSMANIIQFYGHRKVYGLSVSPNPLHRNPAYEPVTNPDRLIRENQLQYVIWDSLSAARSPFFADRVLRYVAKYHGHVANVQSGSLPGADRADAEQPIIVIYELRP